MPHGRADDRHRATKEHARHGSADHRRRARLPGPDRPEQDGDRRAPAERVRGRTARQVLQHAAGRLPHPDAVRGRHPLQALAEGSGARHPGAGLHHARQRAGGRGRRALPEGAEPGARVLRHLRLRVRHLPARADDAAQRGGQDRPRPHVRGAHQHQHVGGHRAGQGVRAVGRQGAPLRDQEHHAAGRHPRRHGEADAGRAGEARGDPQLGRPARRRRSTPRKARSRK